VQWFGCANFCTLVPTSLQICLSQIQVGRVFENQRLAIQEVCLASKNAETVSTLQFRFSKPLGRLKPPGRCTTVQNCSLWQKLLWNPDVPLAQADASATARLHLRQNALAAHGAKELIATVFRWHPANRSRGRNRRKRQGRELATHAMLLGQPAAPFSYACNRCLERVGGGPAPGADSDGVAGFCRAERGN
jgi:hypothetical protein